MKLQSRVKKNRVRGTSGKYTITGAIHLIGAEYLMMGPESEPSKLLERWNPKLEKPTTAQVLYNYLHRHGYAEKKRRIKNEIKGQVELEKRKMLAAAKTKNHIDKVAEAASRLSARRAVKHMHFVDKELEKTRKVITDAEVRNRMEAKDHLDVLDKQDRIARRTYGLDELNQEDNSSKVNLAILVGFDPQPKEAREVRGDVVDVETQTDSSDTDSVDYSDSVD